MGLVYFLHLLSACILVGSAVFVGFAMIPALRKSLPGKERFSFLAALGPRSKALTWTSLVLLFLTGFDMVGGLLKASPWGSGYGRILILKIILALSAAGLMGVHDFLLGPKILRSDLASPEYLKLRRLTMIFGQLQLTLLLAVVYAAVRLHGYSG